MAKNYPRIVVPTALFIFILTIVESCTTSIAADIALFDKAKKEGKLVAYLAINAADAVTVQSSFEKQYPGIKVELVRMGAPSILQRILTEYRGGKTFADVVLGFGFVHYELAQQKLLAKYDSPERQNYVGQFKDPEGYWTNVMSIVHTIAYNSKLVPTSELPSRYADLLQPKWRGKMGVNSNNLMFLAAMIGHFGRDAGMDFLQ